jgi:DNA-binding CsgD family transcriptional regulator
MVLKAQKVVPVPTLLFSAGEAAGRVVRLEAEVATIGRRADSTILLPDPRVSRVHALIRRQLGVMILTDLGSVAGTEVNDKRIVGPVALRHGDTLAFGPVRARFEDPARASVQQDPTLVLDLPRSPGQPHLSPRQKQVLALMAQGLTNSEIGADLGVTERTIKAYAQELYDKLGVRNRAGAVAEAAKLGML